MQDLPYVSCQQSIPKVTLTYPKTYMAQILPGINSDFTDFINTDGQSLIDLEVSCSRI